MINTKVNLNKLVNFNREKDIAKAKKVRELIEIIINSKEFHRKVVSADFQDRRFKHENGKIEEIRDNELILERLLKGKEQFSSESSTDYEWDYQIVLYRSLTGEIGHRSKDTIFTKKKKFRNMTYRNVASHWIHEYVHVIGFTHDFKRTERRPYSIPYLTGTIAGSIMESNEYDFLG
nr:hypothetical protein [uncultured Allomuricauda sp.]